MFDELAETVAMALYNQIMQNFYFNSEKNKLLPSIMAFLPLELLFGGKTHFKEPLYTFSNLFHAEVLSLTDLGAFQTCLLYHCVPKPNPQDPFAHVLAFRQVEEVIERLDQIKGVQIKHHPGIEGAKIIREDLWVKTQVAKAGLQDSKKILDEFIICAN